jgi:hypothetical protein
VWGPALWKFLHVAASVLEDREALIQLLYLLTRCLPCPECRAHLTRHVRDFPPGEWITSVEDAGTYLYLLHNLVNDRVTQRKELYPVDVYESLYGRIDIGRVPPSLEPCVLRTISRPASSASQRRGGAPNGQHHDTTTAAARGGLYAARRGAAAPAVLLDQNAPVHNQRAALRATQPGPGWASAHAQREWPASTREMGQQYRRQRRNKG